ncbi:hypothetical protein ACHAXN_008669, partial [Cyclotella atomus]
QSVDLCIIGGGISGLSAAITAASTKRNASITLLESSSNIGGRVRSDYTSDGYILDRGFAVFIEEYPMSQVLLDYNALGLRQFLPGARVKLCNDAKLAAVSDPLRRRRDIWKAVSSPVGSFNDKLRLAPLFYTVVTKSIEELFDMDEVDTLSCLRGYGFSEEFIQSFFAPFLEGIYLTPLDKQSSRMFHFVFKMFTLGSVSLPKGGMQTVANQLGDKARSLGVDICCDASVCSIQQKDGKFAVDINKASGTAKRRAKSVVMATNERVANQLLSSFIETTTAPPLTQRTVACLYYAFPSPDPLLEPILILNGEGSTKRNARNHPINNVCFPSVVQSSYAPNGHELCSVSVLEKALSEYNGDYEALDIDVRKQLASWFPEHASNILDTSIWVQKEIYVIEDAQPIHFNEENCANVNGGRDCTIFRGEQLPDGMYVCGDYMATSTLNGALESGVNAGNAAAKHLNK